MTFTIILSAFIITLILNHFFVKKISDKTSKICMTFINFILLLAFIILYFVIGLTKKNVSNFINDEIVKIEESINDLYPGIWEKEIDTEDLKSILQKTLEKEKNNNIKVVGINIIKSKMQKYLNSALNIINSLEQEKNKLSISAVMKSVRELSFKTLTKYVTTFYSLLFTLYFILILISILITKYLAKDKDCKNKGVVFGNESDNVFIGMKTE